MHSIRTYLTLVSIICLNVEIVNGEINPQVSMATGCDKSTRSNASPTTSVSPGITAFPFGDLMGLVM